MVKRSTKKRTANPKRAKKMWPHRIEGHSELDWADLRMLDDARSFRILQLLPFSELAWKSGRFSCRGRLSNLICEFRGGMRAAKANSNW